MIIPFYSKHEGSDDGDGTHTELSASRLPGDDMFQQRSSWPTQCVPPCSMYPLPQKSCQFPCPTKGEAGNYTLYDVFSSEHTVNDVQTVSSV